LAFVTLTARQPGRQWLEKQADHGKHPVKQVVQMCRVRDGNLVDFGVANHESVADVGQRDRFFFQPRA
jgi:hypothetical protein